MDGMGWMDGWMGLCLCVRFCPVDKESFSFNEWMNIDDNIFSKKITKYLGVTEMKTEMGMMITK